MKKLVVTALTMALILCSCGEMKIYLFRNVGRDEKRVRKGAYG